MEEERELSALFFGIHANKHYFLALIIGKKYYYYGDMHASPGESFLNAQPPSLTLIFKMIVQDSS